MVSRDFFFFHPSGKRTRYHTAHHKARKHVCRLEPRARGSGGAGRSPRLSPEGARPSGAASPFLREGPPGGPEPCARRQPLPLGLHAGWGPGQGASWESAECRVRPVGRLSIRDNRINIIFFSFWAGLRGARVSVGPNLIGKFWCKGRTGSGFFENVISMMWGPLRRGRRSKGSTRTA